MAYDKEWYKHLKEIGMCTRCGKEKATPGILTCYKCNEKEIEKSRKYREKNKEKANESARNTQQRRRDRGLCRACGKVYTGESATCEICRAKDKKRKERKRKEQGLFIRDDSVYFGMCYFCGEKVVEGKRTCQKHYDILSKHINTINKKGNKNEQNND